MNDRVRTFDNRLMTYAACEKAQRRILCALVTARAGNPMTVLLDDRAIQAAVKRSLL
ncbi:MAG: hypothetical protein ACLR2G_05370 [Phascolarctobacterium faecium]